MQKFLKLRKLDRRFTAYPHFQHMIEVQPNYINFIQQGLRQVRLEPDIGHFFIIREWLWEYHGPSKELKHWLEHTRTNLLEQTSHNLNWCWDTDYHQFRIYLSEDALTSFTLRWM